MRHAFKCLVSAVLLCLAAASVSGSAFAQDTRVMNCSSGGMRYNSCPAGGTIVDVRLVRQISSSPCQQGRTWGFNPEFVWVDRGCRADFAVTVSLIPLPPPQQVNCSSGGMRFNRCELGEGVDHVVLQRQISASPCQEGRSWGSDSHSIWVDRGCRADFLVYRDNIVIDPFPRDGGNGGRE